MDKSKIKLSGEEIDKFLLILEERFKKNSFRHPKLNWFKLKERLLTNLIKLYSLYLMEITGGEPDIFEYDQEIKEYIFFDFSPETPSQRRGLCYDRKALQSRKHGKPENSALDLAQKMGVNLLTEEEYFKLQKYGDFDLKTSSWLKTYDEIRKLGGAIFGEKRYGRTFIFHNSASSYYSVRGFRASLKL